MGGYAFVALEQKKGGGICSRNDFFLVRERLWGQATRFVSEQVVRVNLEATYMKKKKTKFEKYFLIYFLTVEKKNPFL